LVVGWSYHRGLLKKDPRFTSFGTPENLAMLRGKPIGAIDNFEIFISNNVPTSGSAYYVQAGYKGAWSYAEQLLKTEALRIQTAFRDGIRGQHVWGAKVTRPDGLAYVLATAA
jgi:hypothetical protein